MSDARSRSRERWSEEILLKDKTGFADISFSIKPRPKRGDIVKTSGYIFQYGFMNQRVAATYVESIGHVEPEASVTVTPADISSGRFIYRMVTVDGVVTDAFRDEIDPNWNWLSVERDGSKILVNIYDTKLRQSELDKLVDATVVVTGIALSESSGYRKHLSPWIEIPSLSSIRTLALPPRDPFAVEEIKSRVEFLRTAIPRYAHRKRLSGHVLATWDDDSFFLMTKDGIRIRVRMKRGEALPSVGNAVTVSGFVRRNVFFEWFDNSLVRFDSGNPASLEDAKPVAPRDLLFDKSGEVKIQPQFNGCPAARRQTCSLQGCSTPDLMLIVATSPSRLR